MQCVKTCAYARLGPGLVCHMHISMGLLAELLAFSRQYCMLAFPFFILPRKPSYNHCCFHLLCADFSCLPPYIFITHNHFDHAAELPVVLMMLTARKQSPDYTKPTILCGQEVEKRLKTHRLNEVVSVAQPVSKLRLSIYSILYTTRFPRRPHYEGYENNEDDDDDDDDDDNGKCSKRNMKNLREIFQRGLLSLQ